MSELDSKIKGLDVNAQAGPDQDVVQLLAIIRGYCYGFEGHQQSNYALGSAKHRLPIFYQSYEASTTECVEHFKALVGVRSTTQVDIDGTSIIVLPCPGS